MGSVIGMGCLQRAFIGRLNLSAWTTKKGLTNNIRMANNHNVHGSPHNPENQL